MNQTIFLIKGLLAVLGVLLLLWHMNTEWPRMKDNAQRARYLLLLGFGVVMAGASTEQVAEDQHLGYQHLAALLMSMALVGVAAHSLCSSRKEPR